MFLLKVTRSDLLTKSWAGGKDGREVIDRFLKLANSCLDHKSFGYILLLKENKPDEVIEILKNMSFDCEILNSRKLRGEELFILKFEKL